MSIKRTTQIFVVLFILLFVAVLSVILYYYAPHLCSVYSAKLQTPLFTGFLTLGSFLLTLKTFIVVQLKDKLYDSEAYIERFAKLRFQNKDLKLYDPITRLAGLLLTAVVMALGTALLQISLGFAELQITASICFSFAVGTLLLVFFAWWQIRRNIYDLFEIAGQTKEKDIQEMQKRILEESKSQSTV